MIQSKKYSLSYCVHPIVYIKRSCVHSPTPVLTNKVSRYPTLKTYKNELWSMVAMQSFLFSTVLISALDFIVVLWVNSSSTISDGESQMSGNRLKQTLQQYRLQEWWMLLNNQSLKLEMLLMQQNCLWLDYSQL